MKSKNFHEQSERIAKSSMSDERKQKIKNGRDKDKVRRLPFKFFEMAKVGLPKLKINPTLII